MRRSALFTVLVLAAVVVASCSDDTGDQLGTTTSTSLTPTTQQTPTTQAPGPTTAPTTTVTTTTTTLPIPCTVSEPASAEDAGEPGQLIEVINDRGMVRVGVPNFDALPLFSCVEGEFAGFEASLARLLVEGVLGPIEIAWVPLTSAERFEAVRSGGVDFVVRNTTVTPDREDMVDFTTPYLMDGLAVIVPANSAVSDIAGLEGLRIAVVEGSQFEADLIRLLGEAGIAFELVPAQSPDQLINLLASGEVDAYAASWLQGVGAATQDSDLVVLPVEFNQGIAAFTSPSETEFGAAIAEQMQTLIDTGVWAAEFAASFTSSPPWTIEEMAASG